MAKKAENVLPFNSQAVVKAAAKNGQRIEYRIRDVRGLVLDVLPSGAATYRFVYHVRLGAVRKLRTAVAAGTDPMGEGQALRTALTFKELAEKCLAENVDLAATTRTNYRYCLQKDAFPVIGDMPATEVKSDHVIEICKRIEATGARVQSERTKTTIGGVYRWGLRQRLVKANPCKDIGRRSSKVDRRRTPTDAEIAALWAGIDNHVGKLSDAMKLILKIGIVTAQRRTEICGARVSELQLDGDAPVWIIPGDVNKRGRIIEGRTKNGREQHVPLSRQAAELFREAINTCSDGEYVFPANRKRLAIGRQPRLGHIHGDSCTQAMERLREACGIEDLSLHDMRRGCSNWLKDEGISKEVRDLILNHLDPSVTERHYSQASRMGKQVRGALEAWSDHVWEITGQGASESNVVPMRA
jgi:integrase